MKLLSAHLSKWVLQLAAGCIAAFTMSASHATLVYINKVDLNGTGLGNVLTVLTLKDNDGTEAGSVGYSAMGDVKTGNYQNQTQTRSFAELGVTEAADISVIFNPSESQSQNLVTLVNLVLTIYAPDGTLLYKSHDWLNPMDFVADDPGTGNSGFQFALDDPEAIDAQAAAFTGSNYSDQNRIGLVASISNADGGLETHFLYLFDRTQPCVPVGNCPCDDPNCGGGSTEEPLPEPATLVMISTGLLAISCARRRRVR